MVSKNSNIPSHMSQEKITFLEQVKSLFGKYPCYAKAYVEITSGTTLDSLYKLMGNPAVVDRSVARLQREALIFLGLDQAYHPGEKYPNDVLALAEKYKSSCA